MSLKNYGGNIVRDLTGELNQMTLGRFDLVKEAPYEYFMLKLIDHSKFEISELGSFSIYVLSKDPKAKIKVLGVNEEVDVGCALQFECTSTTLSVFGGAAKMLVAGTTRSIFDYPQVTFTSGDQIYKVVKPWGHELWINGEHPTYAIKQIFIKEKTKTSLQFHNFKQETNILFEGNATLHYKANQQLDNHQVVDQDIGCVLLSPVSSIDVKPPTLHRLEAVNDILLYEVSTAHLDDVIRIMDDTERPDGRLEKEHGG